MKRFVQGEYSLAKTWSWSELEERFEMAHVQPLRHLVQQISKSRFRDGVFGTISLCDLLIAQKPIFEMGRDMLRISVTPGGRVRFKYVEFHFLNKCFETESAPGDAFSKFEHIMVKRLKWFFSEEATHSND